MAYGLRPESKRKRPARYHSESEVEPIHGSHSRPDYRCAYNPEYNRPTSEAGDSTAALPPLKSSLGSLPPFLAPFAYSQPAFPNHVQNRLTNTHNMASTTNMRKRSPYIEDEEDEDWEDTEPGVQPRFGVAHTIAQSNATAIYTTMKPTAFPSLPIDEAPSESPKKPVRKYDLHGLHKIMKAHQKGKRDCVKRAQLKFKMIFETKKFPRKMSAKQVEWYNELNGRWLPSEASAKVSYIILSAFAMHGFSHSHTRAGVSNANL